VIHYLAVFFVDTGYALVNIFGPFGAGEPGLSGEHDVSA
jgi:hypothetical protein